MSTSIYIQNKYLTWYTSIISNAQKQSRFKGCGIYYENHHIIPKSFGGSNNKANLVLLTGKEHFICHHPLTKFTQNELYNSMIKSFFMMSNCQNKYHDRYSKLTSKQYQKLREEYQLICSNNIISNKTRQKLSVAKMGKKNNKFNGFYHIPIFPYILESSRQINYKIIYWRTIYNWCKKPDKIITNYMITKSKYLTEDMLGKTFREIGFWFEPIN